MIKNNNMKINMIKINKTTNNNTVNNKTTNNNTVNNKTTNNKTTNNKTTNNNTVNNKTANDNITNDNITNNNITNDNITNDNITNDNITNNNITNDNITNDNITNDNITNDNTVNKYLKINKNNEVFLIENNENNENLSFWENNYTYWENETFEIFDKYLSKDKIFIDIGGWIGTTAMYGSRKSKQVYSIEADNKSFNDMLNNLKINCTNNYTLINKAIFNIDNIKIKFGKNIHVINSKMNDSMSQIYSDDVITNEYYLIETITLDNIIKKYQINVSEISLIKVDIEGGEENILNELYDTSVKYSIPLYISFHYTWWKDKNLDRFSFLSSSNKNKIISEPFTSILF